MRTNNRPSSIIRYVTGTHIMCSYYVFQYTGLSGKSMHTRQKKVSTGIKQHRIAFLDGSYNLSDASKA